MTEAIFRERLQAIIDWADLAMKNRAEFDSHGVRNLDGPVFDAAREALAASPEEQMMDVAVEEYLLIHAAEGDAERLGRRSAIRGLMVRLGKYHELCAALNAASPMSPPAYNGYTCSCHRGSGKMHIVACCSPSPAPNVRDDDAIRAHAIDIICKEAEEMGFPENSLAEFRSGDFDGDDLLTLQAVERALRAPSPQTKKQGTQPTPAEYVQDALENDGILYGPGVGRPLGLLTQSTSKRDRQRLQSAFKKGVKEGRRIEREAAKKGEVR
ncbi:hypothetical protein JNB91_23950 [Rhizobium wenxiniae]|uniref:hypothetical protein n=1 Tax=Rhizobium wenxiniae TaxID=1737357 RepID=UPI001C6F55F6|nr:hypothetical protein [Rhizobium wenxiniae]MBW9090870.1 hypothetical protein [Rhizobium wenxiniae]